MTVGVSIVVPVYRNAATVRELHERVRAALGPTLLTFETLFVVDACPAGSAGAVRELAAGDPRVGAIVLCDNVGQNRAVLAGLAYARGRAVVTMDADLQDPPEAIPRLLRALRAPYAAVFAGRRGAYESVGRRATSRLFKLVLRAASGFAIPADAGLFVAMSRDMADALVRSADPDPYVIALMARAGMPMTSIAVERAPRTGGRSAYSGTARARLAWRALSGLRAPAPAAAAGTVPRRAVVDEVLGAALEGAPGERPDTRR